MKQVIITCDGSSLGNGQGAASRGACAAILSCESRMRAVGAYLGPATNQQAEVIAAATALEALRVPCRVTVYTDSRYVVETMNGNFARKSNEELWSRLDLAAHTHEVTWIWIRGHSSRRKEEPDASIPKRVYQMQEASDNLARAVAALGEVTDDLLQGTIAKVRGLISPEVVTAVMEGLSYLSNACDGARKQDEVGFNKFDAETGHRLARRSTLSEREVDIGRSILRKYHRQLADHNPALLALI